MPGKKFAFVAGTNDKDKLMGTILVRDNLVKVDDSDCVWLCTFNWFLATSASGGKYVRAYVDDRPLSMHNLILGLMPVDHIDGDGLNNRRSNLRPATYSQNNANRRKSFGTSSRYKGVYWNKQNKRWQAQICSGNTNYYLGSFKDEEAAAKAYDTKAVEFWGDYAKTNLPSDS